MPYAVLVPPTKREMNANEMVSQGSTGPDDNEATQSSSIANSNDSANDTSKLITRTDDFVRVRQFFFKEPDGFPVY